MNKNKQLQEVPLPPAAPSVVPPGTILEIRYGHNAGIRQVLMSFNVQVSSITFSPEDAEDVAKKLLYYAEAARGNKPS